MTNQSPVTAVVLTAGLSTRMGGNPKPLLPLGDGTVIEHILRVLTACPLQEIVLVTGHGRQVLEHHVARWPVRTVFNRHYASGEMLSSIQVGVESISPQSDGALIVLGDQPTLAASTIERVIAAFRYGKGSIVIPSFQMRRGHPILIGRDHWRRILELEQGQTMRDFMHTVDAEICHVAVNTPTILRDMDTPDDYERERALVASRV